MQKPIETLKPYISPTHRLCVWALGQVSLPTKAQAETFAKLGAEFDAINATMTGLSNNDARKAFKATMHDPEKCLDWPAVHRRYALKRAAIRRQMLAVSKKAKALMADVFDAASKQMPALSKKIDASERALVSNQGPEQKSVLVQSIEILETHLKLRAKMLRESEGISHPCHLLDN